MNGFNGLVVQTGRSQMYTGFLSPNEHNTWLQHELEDWVRFRYTITSFPVTMNLTEEHGGQKN